MIKRDLAEPATYHGDALLQGPRGEVFFVSSCEQQRVSGSGGVFFLCLSIVAVITTLPLYPPSCTLSSLWSFGKGRFYVLVL